MKERVKSKALKASFLGMTVSWIEVKNEKWKLHSEVIGFQPVSGNHSTGILAITLLDCAIVSKYSTKMGQRYIYLLRYIRQLTHHWHIKLFTIILDNTSNNNTICEAVETFHTWRRYDDWKATENQLPCTVQFF
jgi:predicted HAD superfamily hydrolase